jgi:delta 1-pyrroline-5-carboxylate dehydrogenase
MQPGETPDSVLGHIIKRLGLLVRFASEQTITLDTAAAGGNASLMAADEREYCG